MALSSCIRRHDGCRLLVRQPRQEVQAASQQVDEPHAGAHHLRHGTPHRRQRVSNIRRGGAAAAIPQCRDHFAHGSIRHAAVLRIHKATDVKYGRRSARRRHVRQQLAQAAGAPVGKVVCHQPHVVAHRKRDGRVGCYNSPDAWLQARQEGGGREVGRIWVLCHRWVRRHVRQRRQLHHNTMRHTKVDKLHGRVCHITAKHKAVQHHVKQRHSGRAQALWHVGHHRRRAGARLLRLRGYVHVNANGAPCGQGCHRACVPRCKTHHVAVFMHNQCVRAVTPTQPLTSCERLTGACGTNQNGARREGGYATRRSGRERVTPQSAQIRRAAIALLHGGTECWRVGIQQEEELGGAERHITTIIRQRLQQRVACRRGEGICTHHRVPHEGQRVDAHHELLHALTRSVRVAPQHLGRPRYAAQHAHQRLQCHGVVFCGQHHTGDRLGRRLTRRRASVSPCHLGQPKPDLLPINGRLHSAHKRGDGGQACGTTTACWKRRQRSESGGGNPSAGCRYHRVCMTVLNVRQRQAAPRRQLRRHARRAFRSR